MKNMTAMLIFLMIKVMKKKNKRKLFYSFARMHDWLRSTASWGIKSNIIIRLIFLPEQVNQQNQNGHKDCNQSECIRVHAQKIIPSSFN